MEIRYRNTTLASNSPLSISQRRESFSWMKEKPFRPISGDFTLGPKFTWLFRMVLRGLEGECGMSVFYEVKAHQYRNSKIIIEG